MKGEVMNREISEKCKARTQTDYEDSLTLDAKENFWKTKFKWNKSLHKEKKYQEKTLDLHYSKVSN